MSFRRASVTYRILEAVSDWIGHSPVIGPRWAAFWYNRLMLISWVRDGWLVEGRRDLRKVVQ